MRSRVRVFGLGLIAGLATVSPGVARADTAVSGGADPGSSTINATVHVYDGQWSGRHSSCRWALFLGDTAIDHTQQTTQIVKTVGGVQYKLFTQQCPGQAERLVWVGPPSPRVLLDDAWDRLADRLPKPIPEFAPPADNTFVTIGTWFWTSTAWDAMSVTAWIPTETNGTVWATTTARPVRLVLDPGDGSGIVACDGPGEPWTEPSGDEATSSCSHVFEHTSLVAPDGRAFRGQLRIEWETSWTSSTGAGGALAPLTTSVPVRFVVGEIQALVTGG